MQFSIVSYLDTKSISIVRKLQNDLAELTGSVASINSWLPHVTVGDGIELDEEEVVAYEQVLRMLAKNIKPFDVELFGFSSRDNRIGGVGEDTTPYVLQADVVVNSSLQNLVTGIKEITAYAKKWYVMPKPYKPHVTLAFRDLDSNGYRVGLNFLRDKTISTVISINHIALVKKLPDVDKEAFRVLLG